MSDIPRLIESASGNIPEIEDTLVRLASRMKQSIATGDRRKHIFKKYADCFTGMEAVDWMLENMEAKSIQEAVHLGQGLMKRQFIERVEREVRFEYSRKRFYRFTPLIPEIPLSPQRCLPSSSLEIPLSSASRRRAYAALVGAFVADAASTSLNGVSHPEKAIPNLLRLDFDPAFCGLFDNANDIYTCSTKRQDHRIESSTGFEARIILQCIAKRGHVNGALLAKDAYWGFKTNGRLLSSTTRAWMKRFQSGKTWPHCAVRCKSIDVLSVIPIIVVLYAGTDALFVKVQEFVRVFYTGSVVLDAALVAAFILEQVILGSSVLEALRMSIRSERLSVKQRNVIFKAFTKSQLPSYQAIQKFGNKGSLPKGLCAVLQPLFVLSDYSSAVRENIIGGGRTCRRAMFLGACFAAHGGLESIPEAWLKRTPYFDFVQADSTAILSRREIHGTFYEDEESRNSTPYIDYSPSSQIAVSIPHHSAPYRASIGRCQAKSCDSGASTPRSCASNYSYGSQTSTASSSKSLIDLGEMSKYYQHRASINDEGAELAQDMLRFYQRCSTGQRVSDLHAPRTSDIIIRRSSLIDNQPRGSFHAVL